MLARNANVLIGAPALVNGGLAVAAERVVDPVELRERAGSESFDALIVDPDEMRLEPEELERLRSRREDLRVIVVARWLPVEKALAYMRAGARDVLTADWLDCLPAVL